MTAIIQEDSGGSVGTRELKYSPQSGKGSVVRNYLLRDAGDEEDTALDYLLAEIPEFVACGFFYGYQKDVSLLRTWKMDIRQIFSDSAVKDVHTERDRCWQSAVDNINPTPGATNPLSQAVMYKQLPGGFSRNNGWDMTKITRDTELSIAPVTAVCNHITLIEWLKLDRTEMGGDMAERVMTNGVAEINGLFNLNWIGTIKKRLLPFGHVYLYPATDFLGKSVYIEQLTMNIKKEGPTVQFYMYDEGGSTIGNIGSFGHLQFTGV